MKLNTFEIEDPINLYHAERHIPSEPNIKVSSLSACSICKLPRKPVSINHGGEETMHLLTNLVPGL